MSVTFTQINSETEDATIYRDTNSSLVLTLTNNTGSTIMADSGDDASAFKIYMPQYFTATELGNMNIDLSEWSFDADSDYLLLTYTGRDPYAWEDETDIAFTITNVRASASPTTGSTQINLQNFTIMPPATGYIPLSVYSDFLI